MKVRKIGLGIVLAGFTLASAAPAIAQSDPRGGGGPPGGGASERTGGGGASTSSGTVGGGGGVATGGGGGGGGVSSGSSSGGGAFNSPSGGTASGNFSSIDRGTRATAPERRSGFSESSSQDAQKASPRTAAGSGSGERAVPRGTASGGSSSGSGGDNANSGRTRNPGGNNASGTREVPEWSRPRGDRPATGVAVDRVGPPPDRDRDRDRGRFGAGSGGYYDPYYYGGGYGYGGYGYGSCGIGCTFSPYYYPYGFGMGYGLYSGLGWNPYYGDPMDSYYGGSGGYSSGLYNTRDQGNLKLKVKPRAAKVYVDGYFVGTVDQFDGAFQKLSLNGGRHKVEVRADGFETAEFDVLITPSQTITFQGELKRIQ